MRKLTLTICSFGILYLLISGCIFCTLDAPPNGHVIIIDLLDKTTGRTLIALRDTAYFPDSIFIETARTQRTYRMFVSRRDTILGSQYIQPENLYIDTLYFKYRSTKIDTIVVYFHREQQKACGERIDVLVNDKRIVNGATICEPCSDPSKHIQVRK